MASNRINLDLNVGFISFDDGDKDTILTFAIYEDGDLLDSLILTRSVYDRLLGDDEQGARICYSEVLDDSVDAIFLQEATLKDTELELLCATHRFTLDLRKLDEDDFRIIKRELKELNFDSCFALCINDEEVINDAQIADNIKVIQDQQMQLNAALQPALVFCWYQPDEWQKLKQSAADAEELDDNYKEWKKNANAAISEIRTTGQNVQKINIKMEALEAWCKAEDRVNDSAARSEYAAVIAQQRNK